MYLRIINKYGFLWFIKIAEKENFYEILNRKYINKSDLYNHIFINLIKDLCSAYQGLCNRTRRT